MALRYDVETIAAERFTRTPQGGIVVPAAVARTGVLEYSLADGTVRREYRPPDEVFAPDSLKTLRAVAVTDSHPETPITPDNFKRLAVGQVDGLPRNEGDKLLVADLAINDVGIVEQVESGALKEVSAGYSVDLEETPGITPTGEKYDAIQRSIRFNHVALGGSAWGRSGPEVSLRLDSRDAVIRLSNQRGQEGKNNMQKVIKIDGAEFDFGSEEHIAKIETRADEAEKETSEKSDEVEAMKKKLDELQAENDELKKAAKSDEEEESEEPKSDEEAEGEDVKTDEEEEESEEKTDSFEARVAARVSIERKASELLGTDARFDSKSDRDVMLESIASVRKFDSEGKSDDYVRAVFDLVGSKSSGMSQLVKEDSKGSASRVDSYEEIRRRFEEKQSAAWKKESK